MMPVRLKVGISLLVRRGQQSMWENGIFQNCLFLATLLMRVPCVARVCLVAGGGDSRPEDAKSFLIDSPVPVIDMATAAQELDLMIEMSAQLAPEWVATFRARGGKVVSMRVGNDYVIDIERMMFDKPNGMLISGAAFHEVWTLPEYEQICRPYFATAFRAPVRIVPHLWSPVLLERAIEGLPAGQVFDYQPGRSRWRIAAFEPNICMVKTVHVPLLICDSAHRANPRAIERVLACNTLHMKDHPSFGGLAGSLDITRHGLASWVGRFHTWQMLAAHVDAVVSHHWENGQNYLYYEALHGGYPLVHNSHLVEGCGYRYHDFDCEEGGRALLRALKEHDASLPDYRASARAFLAKLDPEHEANVRVYASAIEALYAESAPPSA